MSPRQCEFLAQMLERTIRKAVPQEIHFLQKFDQARKAIADIVDMPDRKREMLLMRLRKTGGNVGAQATGKGVRGTDRSRGGRQPFPKQFFQNRESCDGEPALAAVESRFVRLYLKCLRSGLNPVP